MSAPIPQDPPTTLSQQAAATTAWAPFRHRIFTVIWTATVVSNIGGWMYNVASGWLMTSLDPNPLTVSMVQVANSLPMFLFAIPAGALMDIVDQRRFLIFGEVTVTITSTAFAALVWLHLITPTGLLLFSFIVTVGSAITFPAWQAVVARLVPKPGLLLGAIGAAAVGGAFLLRPLRVKWGADRLVAAATLATSVATALFAFAHDAVTAVTASLIAGASWIAAVSSLNVSAQVALPEWVRGRGLAMYVTVMFGALTVGSALWGEIAAVAGLPVALVVAAAGACLAIPLTWRWKLQTGVNVDFSPSMHWPDPVTTRMIEPDRGPVLVTIEYRIDPKRRDEFLRALAEYSDARRRDGAYDWGIFEDPAEEGRFIESFRTDSWLEHLRQHQRVTKADRLQEQAVRNFQLGDGPKTTHWIGAQPRGDPDPA
jgi:quinol monooxygenase YgiN